MLKKHIYLPLEILPRELNSKILLSLFAAKKKYISHEREERETKINKK